MQYILLLIAVSQAFLVGGMPTTTIPTPRITELVSQDHAFTVSWSKVINQDAKEPVLGYVVKVWEIPDTLVYKYEIVNGEKVLVEEFKEAKLDMTKIPSFTPREIKVTGADVTTTQVDNVKYNVLYHIRVQAYTKSEKGPLSGAAGIKLLDKDNKTS
ncbi:uncharacterized protein ACR2FA_009384 [Aphomia sociella]